MKKVKQFSTSKFQYISCYCLSVLYKRKKLGTTTFQYISCYCLSSCSSNRDINTSNFNTSHVTVYHLSSFPWYARLLISIHLMLLFIQLPSTLSDSSSVISIHLMLLFILCTFFHHPRFLHFNTSHVTVYLTS